MVLIILLVVHQSKWVWRKLLLSKLDNLFKILHIFISHGQHKGCKCYFWWEWLKCHLRTVQMVRGLEEPSWRQRRFSEIWIQLETVFVCYSHSVTVANKDCKTFIVALLDSPEIADIGVPEGNSRSGIGSDWKWTRSLTEVIPVE